MGDVSAADVELAFVKLLRSACSRTLLSQRLGDPAITASMFLTCSERQQTDGMRHLLLQRMLLLFTDGFVCHPADEGSVPNLLPTRLVPLREICRADACFSSQVPVERLLHRLRISERSDALLWLLQEVLALLSSLDSILWRLSQVLGHCVHFTRDADLGLFITTAASATTVASSSSSSIPSSCAAWSSPFGHLAHFASLSQAKRGGSLAAPQTGGRPENGLWPLRCFLFQLPGPVAVMTPNFLIHENLFHVVACCFVHEMTHCTPRDVNLLSRTHRHRFQVAICMISHFLARWMAVQASLPRDFCPKSGDFLAMLRDVRLYLFDPRPVGEHALHMKIIALVQRAEAAAASCGFAPPAAPPYLLLPLMVPDRFIEAPEFCGLARPPASVLASQLYPAPNLNITDPDHMGSGGVSENSGSYSGAGSGAGSRSPSPEGTALRDLYRCQFNLLACPVLTFVAGEVDVPARLAVSPLFAVLLLTLLIVLVTFVFISLFAMNLVFLQSAPGDGRLASGAVALSHSLLDNRVIESSFLPVYAVSIDGERRTCAAHLVYMPPRGAEMQRWAHLALPPLGTAPTPAGA